MGDVKQSIYGWRDGDPELFDGILDDKGLTAIAATTSRDNLPFNWRSSRQVVEHNNALFSPLEQPETARAVMSALLQGDMPPDLRDEIMNSSVAALVSAFEGTTQQCPEHAPEGGLVQVEDCLLYTSRLILRILHGFGPVRRKGLPLLKRELKFFISLGKHGQRRCV